MLDVFQLSSVKLFFTQLLDRSLEIITAPKNNSEALWLLVPLLITVFLMEFYFGRYTKEELGWNTAYGNAMVLVFIAASLLKYINDNGLWLYTNKIIVVGALIFLGVFLTIIDYFHLVPEKLAFRISSKLPINFLAYVSIILVYTNIPLDALTALSFICLLVILSIFVWFVHEISPKVRESTVLSSVPEPNKAK